MRSGILFLALAGGGVAWTLHLFAGYFLVSLGCPRGWALTGTLLAVTAVCAASALAVAIVASRQRKRVRHGSADGETPQLLLGVSALLAALFAVMIIFGGLAVAALSPCQAAVGGAP